MTKGGRLRLHHSEQEASGFLGSQGTSIFLHAWTSLSSGREQALSPPIHCFCSRNHASPIARVACPPGPARSRRPRSCARDPLRSRRSSRSIGPVRCFARGFLALLAGLTRAHDGAAVAQERERG